MKRGFPTVVLLVLLAVLALQLGGCIHSEEFTPDVPVTHGTFPRH